MLIYSVYDSVDKVFKKIVFCTALEDLKARGFKEQNFKKMTIEKKGKLDLSEVDDDDSNLLTLTKLLNITNIPKESEILLQDQIEFIYKSVVNLRPYIVELLIPIIRKIMREKLIRSKGSF